MNRLNIFVIGLFFAMAVFTGCNKEKQGSNEFSSECDEFCLYANAEDFYKTAPFIDDYLKHLSKNDWSDERKLKALAEWLNAKPCIVSAELEPVIKSDILISPKSTPVQPPKGTIAILLNENGTTEAIFLEIGPRYPYESDLWVATGYRYMIPREVGVLIQSASSVSMVFDFINTFDFEVLRLLNLYFYSTAHSLDHVLNNFSNLYIAGVGTIPGSPIFTPTFHSMNNKTYQDDWLKFMADYQIILTNSPFTDQLSAGITFLVPAGKEREWSAKFLENYDFVISTDVNWGFRSM